MSEEGRRVREGGCVLRGALSDGDRRRLRERRPCGAGRVREVSRYWSRGTWPMEQAGPKPCPYLAAIVEGLAHGRTINDYRDCPPRPLALVRAFLQEPGAGGGGVRRRQSGGQRPPGQTAQVGADQRHDFLDAP